MSVTSPKAASPRGPTSRAGRVSGPIGRPRSVPIGPAATAAGRRVGVGTSGARAVVLPATAPATVACVPATPAPVGAFAGVTTGLVRLAPIGPPAARPRVTEPAARSRTAGRAATRGVSRAATHRVSRAGTGSAGRADRVNGPPVTATAATADPGVGRTGTGIAGSATVAGRRAGATGIGTAATATGIGTARASVETATGRPDTGRIALARVPTGRSAAATDRLRVTATGAHRQAAIGTVPVTGRTGARTATAARTRAAARTATGRARPPVGLAAVTGAGTAIGNGRPRASTVGSPVRATGNATRTGPVGPPTGLATVTAPRGARARGRARS